MPLSYFRFKNSIENNLLLSCKLSCISGYLLRYAFAVILFINLYGCSGTDDYEYFAEIHGVISDYQTEAPIENAIITLSPSGISIKSDANGFYRFEELDPRQYTITVQKNGYQPNRKTITATSGESQQADIQLTIIPQ